MAIFDSYPTIEVTVHVDGQALPEFKNDEEPDQDRRGECRMIRYIETQPERNFAVHLQMGKDRDWSEDDSILEHDIYLDGQAVSQKCSRKSTLNSPAGWLYVCSGINEFSSYHTVAFRKFKFAGVRVAEDNGNATEQRKSETYKELGEIRVEFHRSRFLSSHERPETTMNFAGVDQLPEKALKGRAISQQTALGEAVVAPLRTVSSYTTERLDGGRANAVFIFRYRSHADLRAECIIPRSPSPVPLEDRPLEDLTPEELRELVRRNRESRNTKREQQSGVKRERAESTSVTNDGEVQFVQERPAKRVVLESIDLTDD